MLEIIQKFMVHLKLQVTNHDIYVLGGQGQKVVDILPKIPAMESVDRTKQILGRIRQNFYDYKDFNVFVAKAYDCSGLGTDFFLDEGLIKSDTTANGLYTEYCNEISFSELQEGDAVFQEDSKGSQHHVGYYIGDGKLIEAKGRIYGVVESVFKRDNWTHAGRFKFWDKQPEKYTLTRELSYTNPMMRGDDIEEVQKRLNYLGYNCGDADGVFGKKTDIAVKNFQSDKGLTVDGIIGKHTAEALGFKWEG